MNNLSNSSRNRSRNAGSEPGMCVADCIGRQRTQREHGCVNKPPKRASSSSRKERPRQAFGCKCQRRSGAIGQ